ncbi:MAG TPA: PIN domain-containing protein [Candidatus Kapabacteria bacterium]|nr:PIN domain-containing protein [Candidatus Kapabacteria bacterium]
MRVVFADAFYFVARLNRRDQYRGRVHEYMKDFEGRLVTTDWVLMEVLDALTGSEIRDNLRDFILELRLSESCEIIEASRELFDRGLTFFHRHSDKAWTLTDCTSFVVMRDLGIKEALTGDKHFEQAGFTALLK